MVLEWNSQLDKAIWCQRERWHHLPCDACRYFAGQELF